MSQARGPTVAWFHCFAGVAGDMALGAVVDAGADAEEVRGLLSRLDLPGWELRFEDVLRGGVACTRAIVNGDDVVVRTYGAIASLIEQAALPERVTQRALAVFHALAGVEAALHRRPIDQVHFHEVGGHDAIVDVVGTASALEVLGVDELESSAVATGTGMVRSAHGRLPNPAPATVRLLEGVPTYGRDVGVEFDDADGSRAGRDALLVLRAAAGDVDQRVRLWRRDCGTRRPAQLHPGGDRPADTDRRRRRGGGSRGARDQPR